MSLFENDQYRWRETYFVLFKSSERPTAEKFERALKELGTRYEFDGARTDDDGRFESATLESPYDFAAMDISYMEGEDVANQVTELNEQLKHATLNGDELKKLAKLHDCDARFDVFHFEKVVSDEDEFLDPGALLVVLEKLADLCNGVSIDGQSNSFI
jgi:hypothetical protein